MKIYYKRNRIEKGGFFLKKVYNILCLPFEIFPNTNDTLRGNGGNNVHGV